MFRNAKVGDRVWHIRYGKGVINEMLFSSMFVTARPVRVTFDNGKKVHFTLDGKEDSEDMNPTLFWDEIKFKIPKKPFDLEKEFRKLERKEFEMDKENFSLFYRNEKWDFHWTDDFFEVGMIYFKSGVNVFVDLLNEHKITPRQLNEIVRKVEREEKNESL